MEQKPSGLSFPYMLNAMAISILSEDVWDKPDIEFDRMEEFQEQDHRRSRDR